MLLYYMYYVIENHVCDEKKVDTYYIVIVFSPFAELLLCRCASVTYAWYVLVVYSCHANCIHA